MRNYIKENIRPNETILIETNPSKWIYIRPSVWFILFLTIFILVFCGFVSSIALILIVITFFGSILSFIKAFITRKFTEYTVTDQRIISKHGFIRVSVDEIKKDKVENVKTSKSILERLITKEGTVIVTGSGSSIVKFKNTPHPEKVRNLI